jgi:hypothetical protein
MMDKEKIKKLVIAYSIKHSFNMLPNLFSVNIILCELSTNCDITIRATVGHSDNGSYYLNSLQDQVI